MRPGHPGKRRISRDSTPKHHKRLKNAMEQCTQGVPIGASAEEVRGVTFRMRNCCKGCPVSSRSGSSQAEEGVAGLVAMLNFKPIRN